MIIYLINTKLRTKCTKLKNRRRKKSQMKTRRARATVMTWRKANEIQSKEVTVCFVTRRRQSTFRPSAALSAIIKGRLTRK